MIKKRLDQLLFERGMVASRSQAESYIKLGYVSVDGRVVAKPGTFVDSGSKLKLDINQQYVSRAALKLAGAADKLKIDFQNKKVLDVGSSTGGFTDFALRNGAKKVIAVDVGRAQLHQSLRVNPKIELHEGTDIREFAGIDPPPDLILIDTSFISLRLILPAVLKQSAESTLILAMAKPQFEADKQHLNNGVIKNDRLRREVLKSFETWVKQKFNILDKTDSPVAGAKGNIERFYLMKKL